MVTECGMSDGLGPLAFASNGEETGLGWSESTVAEIDAETRRIVRDAWKTATDVLAANRGPLGAMADELIASETLEGEALAAILRDVVSPVDTGLWNDLASTLASTSAIARGDLGALAS